MVLLLRFEFWSFEFVWDFGFRALDFNSCYVFYHQKALKTTDYTNYTDYNSVSFNKINSRKLV